MVEHRVQLDAVQHGAFKAAHVARCACGWRSAYYIPAPKDDPDIAKGYARRDRDQHLAEAR